MYSADDIGQESKLKVFRFVKFNTCWEMGLAFSH